MIRIDEITNSDIISLISLILTIIGGLFAYIKWKESNEVKRANQVRELIEKFRNDEDIEKLIYTVDYGKDWYSIDFHDNNELEPKFDKALTYFSYLCYLRNKKILYKEEFVFFEYELTKILNDDNVIDYLYNLYHYENQFCSSNTFSHLINYGKEKKIIDDDFFDKESYLNNDKYHKNLNF